MVRVGVTTDGLKASGGKSASVNVDVELANTRAEKGEYTVKSILKSPEGNAIGGSACQGHAFGRFVDDCQAVV